MNIDGSEQTLLIKQGDNGWVEQSGANWSPDGQKIIMAVAVEKNGPLTIMVTDNQGKNPQQLIKRKGYFADPAFSPDGNWIAYVAWPEDYIGTSLGHLEIFVMKADGSEETRLTYDEFRDHDPAWSLDSKMLVFETATRPGNIIVGKWGIRTMPIAAEEPKNVVFNEAVNLMPQWLPGRNGLIFQQVTYLKNRAQLLIVNTDGSNPIPITDGKYDDKEVNLLP
ncbi:translocation protein TolB [compost metagenome]